MFSISVNLSCKLSIILKWELLQTAAYFSDANIANCGIREKFLLEDPALAI